MRLLYGKDVINMSEGKVLVGMSGGLTAAPQPPFEG